MLQRLVYTLNTLHGICPHSNDCQFLHRKRSIQFVGFLVRPPGLSQLKAISSKVVHLMVRDRPPDPSRMLLVRIWQRFSELACVRVELLEESTFLSLICFIIHNNLLGLLGQ